MTLVVDVKYILLSFCRYNSNAQTKVYKMSQPTLIFYHRNFNLINSCNETYLWS